MDMYTSIHADRLMVNYRFCHPFSDQAENLLNVAECGGILSDFCRSAGRYQLIDYCQFLSDLSKSQRMGVFDDVDQYGGL